MFALIDAARGAPLRSLTLSLSGGWDHRVEPQFAELLNSLPFLHELDLSFLTLRRLKLNLPQLHKLSLTASIADLESGADGLPFLFAGCRQLREIDVTVDESFGASRQALDKFLQSLAECLKRNGTVQSLTLGGIMDKVEASAATWAKLAKTLRYHPTITAVTIASNNLGDEGMLAMQAAVQRNAHITSVRISRSEDLSKTGLQAFLVIEQTLRQRLQLELERARLPAADAPPVERKEDVESRSEAHSLAAASSSTDKPAAAPSSSMSAAGSDPSWDPQKPLSVRRQLCEQEEALIRTVQQLSLAETELERARNNHQLQQAERTQQIQQRERRIAALSQQHQRLSAEHQTLQAQLAAEVQQREVQRADLVSQMAQLQRQRDQLSDEIDELRERRQCCICKDSEVDAMFLACNHTVCCEACAQQCAAQGSCPICRVIIGRLDVRRVHLA